MTQEWPENFAERMRWARRKAGHKTPTDAARFLAVRPGTYRTYEAEEGDGARQPPLEEIQRIARRFQVSWTWLAVGEGRPDQGVLADDRVEQINQAAAQLPAEEREAALDAALGVVRAFTKRNRA